MAGTDTLFDIEEPERLVDCPLTGFETFVFVRLERNHDRDDRGAPRNGKEFAGAIAWESASPSIEAVKAYAYEWELDPGYVCRFRGTVEVVEDVMEREEDVQCNP